MSVSVHFGLAQAPSMRGMAVVIDVFRATTTLACLVTARAKRIVVLRDPHELAHYAALPDHACFSEVVPVGHDNSPLTALHGHLGGTTAVIATTSGTRAIVAARHCDRVLTAGFVNLDAVVAYLLAQAPDHVSILASGFVPDGSELIEDTLCARTLQSRLTGERVDEVDLRRRLQPAIEARRHDPDDPAAYPRYADICFAIACGILDAVPEVHFCHDVIWVADARQGYPSPKEER